MISVLRETIIEAIKSCVHLTPGLVVGDSCAGVLQLAVA